LGTLENRSSPPVKFRRSDVVRGVYRVPAIRCENADKASLTSFAGLVIFQNLFSQLGIKQQLRRCFGHLRKSATYRGHDIVFWLIVHLILGFRKLRDRDYYHDDPMTKRLLGLNRLPDVATISRSLAAMDEEAVFGYRALSRNLVLDRLEAEQLTRVTLDFDGSVLSTARHAEGTAIGFNKKKKGARSYYPLFCTVGRVTYMTRTARSRTLLRALKRLRGDCRRRNWRPGSTVRSSTKISWLRWTQTASNSQPVCRLPGFPS
jgi:hypothetical protein